MNDLIASVAPGPALSECYKTIAVVGPVGSLAESIGSGDVFGGFASALSLATDVAATLVDPIAALGSSIASFLLDYFPPLTFILDALAGNPAQVAAKSGTWENIANRLVEVKGDLLSEVDRSLSGWTGPTASAYRSLSSGFGSVMDGIAQACSAVAVGFKAASVIIEFVRGIVKQLISDLVGQLISAVVEIAATVGFGATVVVPQCLTKILKYARKAQEWSDGLTAAIKNLSTTVDKINTTVHTAIGGLNGVQRNLTIVSVSGLVSTTHDTYHSATQ